MNDEQQAKVGCIIGKDYPKPIIDHAVARRHALEMYGTVSAANKDSDERSGGH